MTLVDVLLHTDPPRLARAIVDRWAGELPFVNVFYARVGQVIGTRENFADLLDDDQLVLVFPEGIEGIRKTVTHRYRLQSFRVGFVEQALRAGAPIVPMAVIGSDDQTPILYDLKPLARALGLPVAPITPTFPWLGPLGLLPYPVRYKIVYGEPLALPRALRARGRRRRAAGALPRAPGAPRGAAARRSEPHVTRVLVTHADEPIGRRVVKRLFHDPRVDAIFAVGDGPTPRSFDRFLARRRTRGELRARRSRQAPRGERPVPLRGVPRRGDRHRRAPAAPRRRARSAGADRGRALRAHRGDAPGRAALPRGAPASTQPRRARQRVRLQARSPATRTASPRRASSTSTRACPRRSAPGSTPT